MKSKKYSDLVDSNNCIISHTQLTIDCVYESDKKNPTWKGDILSKLMSVKNQAGVRYIIGKNNKEVYKYIVLFTTGKDTYWVDFLDSESGIFTFFGDNKVSGRSLHDTNGNRVLRDVYNLLSIEDTESRKKVPPIFIFQQSEHGRDVKFLGLAAPGAKTVNPKEWLVALWASREDKTRFQNYKAIMTVLDTSSGSKHCPMDANIDIGWLKDLRDGKGYESEYAPLVWKQWVDGGKYTPLVCRQEQSIRTKNQQLPNDSIKEKMLEEIYHYFCDRPTDFEKFAIDIALLLDNNILSLEKTRPVKDGGKDGEGLYRVGIGDSSFVFPFVLEAKCYNHLKNSVGVKETSRLISRIKNREFGVFVTTSYIAQTAYEEIIEDKHPIIIISGVDIINLLESNGVSTIDAVREMLIKY